MDAGRHAGRGRCATPVHRPRPRPHRTATRGKDRPVPRAVRARADRPMTRPSRARSGQCHRQARVTIRAYKLVVGRAGHVHRGPTPTCEPVKTRRSAKWRAHNSWLAEVMHENETARRDAVNAQVNGLARRRSWPAGVMHHKAGTQDVKAAGGRHVGRTGVPQYVLCMPRTESRRSAASSVFGD